MASVNAATWIGSISVLLWGTLALLTKLSGGEIPEFQLMAMTFGIAFLLMCGRWVFSGHSGVRYLRQSPLAWCIGVVGLFGYHHFRRLSGTLGTEVLLYLEPLAGYRAKAVVCLG